MLLVCRAAEHWMPLFFFCHFNDSISVSKGVWFPSLILGQRGLLFFILGSSPLGWTERFLLMAAPVCVHHQHGRLKIGKVYLHVMSHQVKYILNNQKRNIFVNIFFFIPAASRLFRVPEKDTPVRPHSDLLLCVVPQSSRKVSGNRDADD